MIDLPFIKYTRSNTLLGMGRDAALYARLRRATDQEAASATSSNPAIIKQAVARQKASDLLLFFRRESFFICNGHAAPVLKAWPVIPFQRLARASCRDCAYFLRPITMSIFGLRDMSMSSNACPCPLPPSLLLPRPSALIRLAACDHTRFSIALASSAR